ncbi:MULTISPECIES: GTP cyclohydrolase I [Haloferax]|uniref:GTP cyclohydrolase I n=2 Tax=Haloferax TaxID=2251 RepID=A0A6G1Z799_9EURY|nr:MULTISPECIES: GTP cyclohydrolase I FolE [Haloferax]KAB1184799.1 GTP cyclohydrolase I FolE [Haloferax sp. CBA1149]MRW82430.1 GTP cyclohydrolase I FolE [Haloferax marinisediminis]
MRLLLEAIGANPEGVGLEDTWKRRVPQTFETLTEGYHEEEKPTMRTFPTKESSAVVKTSIPLYSLCEHHLLPYHGVAHVAYIPDERVVGLSKLSRYVRWQSRRLTVQESLTQDIAVGLNEEVGAEGVIVEITATHLCEAMRGVERETETTTRAIVGNVTNGVVRQFERTIDRSTRQ